MRPCKLSREILILLGNAPASRFSISTFEFRIFEFRAIYRWTKIFVFLLRDGQAWAGTALRKRLKHNSANFKASLRRSPSRSRASLPNYASIFDYAKAILHAALALLAY